MASFHKQLVLNQWLLGFFKGGSLQGLKLRLGEDRHEGIDEDGQTLVVGAPAEVDLGGDEVGGVYVYTFEPKL